MTDYNDQINALEDDADGLNNSLAQTSALVTGFGSELDRMRDALGVASKDVAGLERGLSTSLSRAFKGVVFDSMSLSDALESVASSMVNTAYNSAMRPVTNHVGGMISDGVSGLVGSILPFANGAPFSQGRVMPFANGGIVSSATPFGMRGGLGVMGEAGPEAIMPLARGPDGQLGVRGGGGGGTQVVMNIQTQDAESFRRSQSQIAAGMNRALGRGDRNR
ncbi:MAG: phage tail tape measure protein [Pseudomonadota bacterium]